MTCSSSLGNVMKERHWEDWESWWLIWIIAINVLDFNASYSAALPHLSSLLSSLSISYCPLAMVTDKLFGFKCTERIKKRQITGRSRQWIGWLNMPCLKPEKNDDCSWQGMEKLKGGKDSKVNRQSVAS